ncbi:MAG TPA: hypothetical protein VLG40_02675 [Candidatus Saccharimonas sp.]|nr:hypothetical protein [Candidatus Saccharimonas sp.]
MTTLEKRPATDTLTTEDAILDLAIRLRRIFDISFEICGCIAKGLYNGSLWFGSVRLDCERGEFQLLNKRFRQYVRPRFEELRAAHKLEELTTTDEVAMFNALLAEQIDQMFAGGDLKRAIEIRAYFEDMGVWASLLMGTVRYSIGGIDWCGLAKSLSCYDLEHIRDRQELKAWRESPR